MPRQLQSAGGPPSIEDMPRLHAAALAFRSHAGRASRPMASESSAAPAPYPAPSSDPAGTARQLLAMHDHSGPLGLAPLPRPRPVPALASDTPRHRDQGVFKRRMTALKHDDAAKEAEMALELASIKAALKAQFASQDNLM